MNELYVGLIAVLVSGALIMVGCHIGMFLATDKTTLDRRTTQGQAGVQGIDEIRTTTPTRTIIGSDLQTQTRDPRPTQFRGFHSPPGRF